MLPGAELPHGQAERAKASAACLLCLSFKDDVVSEMTEPRSLPGAFQARPQEKHLNNRILLLAAPRVYRSGVCGALILAGAPPPACSYTSGEGDGCTNRRQSTFCVTVPLPGHRTATAVHSRRKGTGSLVAGGRRFAAGLAPRRTGTERVQAAHVPGRRDGSRSQPLKAGGGGLGSPALAPQRSRPKRCRGLLRSPSRRQRHHKHPLGLDVCQVPSVSVPTAASGSSFGRG